MDALKQGVARRFLMVLLLLSCSSLALAQAVNVAVNPTSVADPTKPVPVTLRVTKPGGAAVDADFNNQLKTVKVGGVNVQFSLDTAKGEITLTPPPNLKGAQKVELLTEGGQPLGETQLQYAEPTSAGATSARAPDRVEDRRDRLMNSNWYYLIVTALFGGLIIPFAYTIYRVIRFSKSSFRNPLGFPVASFRAILAYTLVAYLGFYILTSILSVATFEPPEYLLGIVATVVGFYFGSRTGEEGMVDPSAGIVRGIVRLGTNPARGALVEFKRDDGKVPYTRITDVEGHFELRGARAGDYTVTATITGSSPSDPKKITVAEGSDQEMELVIKAAGGTQSPPPGAKTGALQGTVTKASDNSPADGATVVLSQNGVEKGRDTTKNGGKYKIDNVAFGDYEIVASVGGVAGTAKPVKVAAASVTFDFQV